jgi:hypothetical protein
MSDGWLSVAHFVFVEQIFRSNALAASLAVMGAGARVRV